MSRPHAKKRYALALGLAVSLFGFLMIWGCGSKTQTYTLTVLTSGPGTGMVTSSPSGISCPTTCSASFNSGTAVSLTATPGSGSIFSGWSEGVCNGTSACNVTMTTNQSVTSTFALDVGTLTVEISPSSIGSVTSTDGQINCPGTCSATYGGGATVTLNANPAAGYSFMTWSGLFNSVSGCNQQAANCEISIVPGETSTAIAVFQQ
jgi:hypothetical protein